MATIKDTLVLEDKMTQTLNKINSAMDKFQKGSKKSMARVVALGSALGNISANLAMRAIDGLKNSMDTAIQDASALIEVQNVVDKVFENSADTINKWSKTTVEKFGINELTAKRFTSTIGAMMKSAGITGSQLSDMSMSIAGLAGDMASFYDMRAEEAFAKLRSGISGEAEPLKQIGIDLTEARLKVDALSLGLGDNISKLSQSEKVMLRYHSILRQTAFAHGDFNDTSLTFANQQRILEMNWRELTASIAQYALPALTEGMIFLNKTIKALDPIIRTAILNITISFYAVKKFFFNLGAWIMNMGYAVYNGYANIINGIIGLFQTFANFVINTLTKVAKVIDAVFKTNLSSELKDFQKTLNAEAEKAKKPKKNYISYIFEDSIDKARKLFDKGADSANKSDKTASKAINPLDKTINGNAINTKQQGAIELKEEDVKMLNELASRDFMVRYQSLSPQVNFGNVTVNENADVEQLISGFSMAVTEMTNNSMSTGVGK